MTTLKLKLNPSLVGPAPNLSVGTVTTLEHDEAATVDINGTSPDYTINFGIPIGAPGGDISDGDKGDITVSDDGATWTVDAGAINTSKLGGDITTAGKAILDDADASAQRTTLGLAIGTNVQAFNARLSDLAAITWAQGDVIYYNGTNLVNLGPGTSGHFLKTNGAGANPAWAAAPGAGGATLGDGDYGDIVVSSSGTVMSIDSGVLTAAGRALIDDADAATQRTTLGLGTADNPQFATIELGAASDTTLSRSSAGVLAVEGVIVPLNSITNIHTAQQIELGHASDTTLSRSSAGVLAVEGVTVPLNSITNIHTAQQIELGHASDTTITRASAGVAAVEGSNILTAATGIAQGKHTIWVPATAMVSRTTNGAAAGTVEMTTNKNMVKTLDFDATTQEFAQFEVAMPKSWNESTVTFQPVWSHPSTTTNFGVVWALQAVATSDDDALDVAFGTEQTSTDTGGTTDDRYIGPESSAITIGGSPAEGDVVQFQIKRNPSDGSDTMAVDARMHGVKIYITLNASTDA